MVRFGASVLVMSILGIFTPSPRAEVTVADDEVIFTLIVPGAKNVFLVGDFNNWNPTLEKMSKDGDTFSVFLFLLPGSYHYKFVVDGTWGADPDNPTSDPRAGSFLVLEERGGMLAMGTDAPLPPGQEPALVPSIRYVGLFEHDNGSSNSEQRIDVWFEYQHDRFTASVDLKTLEDSWGAQPLTARIDFDRGFLTYDLGKATVKGFENDSTWSSTDPFQMVGDVGVFDYNAGFERKGATFVWPMPLNLDLRFMYTDKLEAEELDPVTIPVAGFGSFATTTTPDTVVYAYKNRYDDSDTWAFELSLDVGDFEVGWVTRQNRGFHPGLLVEARRDTVGFSTKIYNTREKWDAWSVWLGWDVTRDVSIVGGYGYSRSDIVMNALAAGQVSSLGEVRIDRNTVRVERELPLQTNAQWVAGIETKRGLLEGNVMIDWADFNFAATGSSARIIEIDAVANYVESGWRASGRLGWGDWKYGTTPDDFSYWTQARNFWLDYRDKLDVINMVNFGLENGMRVEAYYAWNPSEPFRRRKELKAAEVSVEATADAALKGFLERVDYMSARLAFEIGITRGFYGQIDGRFASYGSAVGGGSNTYFDTYFELGFRRDWTEISLGIGFDPMVFDPIVNRYADIGRLEFLRQAIPGVPVRSQAGALVAALQSLERELEKTNAFKLEVIFAF